MSRFLIGIDLGTSNSSLAYVDTLALKPRSTTFTIRQLESPGRVIESPVLPSFLYLATDEEAEGEELLIGGKAWSGDDHALAGLHARERAIDTPGRVIHSAKSWLCHDGVDRRDRILPWGSDDVEAKRRMSPVSVSAAYLRHIRSAWDEAFAEDDSEAAFVLQDVTITVPASFDEVAQRLVLEAAKLAGYPKSVRLLEEPQAAFYYWLEKHGDDAASLAEVFVETGKEEAAVLVCDIGGGTTDFSLFLVSPDDGRGSIRRIAVSDHLLLGGDNIDLALSHLLEQRLGTPGKKLDSKQWSRLVYQARMLKERVLSDNDADDEEDYTVSVDSRGGSLVAGALRASVTRREVREMILEGFFPLCSPSDVPQRRHMGLTEWGLPFVADTAVTRHLASFLAQRKVDAVLFAGGMLKPRFLQQRLLSLIASWQGEGTPCLLESDDLALGVSRGASYYGWLLHSRGRRIAADSARSVYLELGSEAIGPKRQLLCVAGQGTQAGAKWRLSGRSFKLLVGRAVRFQPYSSTHRPEDRAGDIVDYEPEAMRPLSPLETALESSEKKFRKTASEVEVELEASLNELGMLELRFIERESEAEPRRWRLDFNLRKEAGGEDDTANFDVGVSSASLKSALSLVETLYGKKQTKEAAGNPKHLVRDLERVFGLERSSWNVGLLRCLWPALSKGMTRKGRSLAHETSWLYLSGFVLRPGYGVELDRWRVHELWRVFDLGLSFPREVSAQVQWWVMWRRVAGGLERERQEQLLFKVEPFLEKKETCSAEAIRVAGSLERVSLVHKERLLRLFCKRVLLRKAAFKEDYLWGLSRLLGRVPLYGEMSCVVPSATVVEYSEALLGLDWKDAVYQRCIPLFVQACRLTEDRNRDVPPEFRRRVIDKMRGSGVEESRMRPLRELVEMGSAEQTVLFGEELPVGLKLAGKGNGE